MDTLIQYTYLPSPLGPLLATAEGSLLTGLYLPNHKGRSGPDPAWRAADEPFARAREQLDRYFAGELHGFDLPLRLAGTPYQRRVWQELVQIPFGTTITYAQLAARIGQPGAARAVGHANSRNPISIIVPCHRVIGADGSLAGYAGGLDKKRWLLEHERQASSAERGTSGSQRELVFADQSAGSRLNRSPSIAARSGRS
ncbi:MAG: methylated-DNA--[protein]-cysteine S-methyltransferase [Planctomycetota bacterium]|nr:MAG: methylated-DNA--[protein]-cysteine S-methyltransferase [Planctomycetota bacterium]